MSSEQTSLPLPTPRRTPGLEDSVLATVRKHPRGITPARLAEIFSGRAVSSQCSRLVAKGLIERRAGNLFPVAVAAPVAAPDESRVLVAGNVVGNPPSSPPPLFREAPAPEAAAPEAPESPLRAWLIRHRLTISRTTITTEALLELEELVDRADSDREELAKIEQTKLDLHKAANDLRTLRALFEDVTGPDLVSKAAHALSAVETLAERDMMIQHVEHRLRACHLIGERELLGSLMDKLPEVMPHYVVEKVGMVDDSWSGKARISFTGHEAAGWIGKEIMGSVTVLPVAK